MKKQNRGWLNSVLLLGFQSSVMKKKTTVTPLWKLDVELGKYILTRGHAR